MPAELLCDCINTQPGRSPAGDLTTFIEINVGLGAFHCIFLVTDNPLVSFASRTSSLNPPSPYTCGSEVEMSAGLQS